MTFRTFDTDDAVIVFFKEDHEKEYAECVEIPYEWELANSEGARYTFRPGPEITQAQILAAKACISRDHDVVQFCVNRQ